MGDGVRIGAHTSILGFNHSMEPGQPVFRQPLTSKGIEIGDDVWIGSHVVILDGVRVGSHSVLAASAVVTKDVPEGAVVGGNPARFMRWRVEPDDTGIAPDAAADAAARGTAGADTRVSPAAPLTRTSDPFNATERRTVERDDPTRALGGTAGRTSHEGERGRDGSPRTDADRSMVGTSTDGTDENGPGVDRTGGGGTRRTDAGTSTDTDENGPATHVATTQVPSTHVATTHMPATHVATTSGIADGLAERLAELAARARSEASTVLQRAWREDLGLFADRPGIAPTIRAQGDAIEIADLLLGSAPPQAGADEQVRRLRAWQDASTGAVPPLDAEGRQSPLPAPERGRDDSAVGATAALDFSHDDVAYHVLSVGYALDLLGSAFPAPLTWVTAATPEGVVEFCESLPWATDAWGAGHHIDGFGTALLWTKRSGHPIPAGVEEALFGWLVLNADPQTGMWGRATPDRGLLPVVNGFYRASRGTFAQFGVPLPYPERVVDTVLQHARDPRWFAPGARNACNVLDVAHPLWLTRSTGYRGEEVRDLAARLLTDAVSMWVPDAGFAFREPSPATAGLGETEPGLQGTEMWLAILWYLADLAGISDALGYRPRGVHRPEPAGALR
jgi:hypothetical protein